MLARYAYLTSMIVVLWQLESIAQQQPGKAVVAGTITYAGRPIHEVTSAPVEFSFRGDKGEVTPRIVYERGNYAAFDLPPGSYTFDVYINANPHNPRDCPYGYGYYSLCSGDFLSQGNAFEVSTWYRGAKVVHIKLAQLIHITKPFDNDKNLGGGCEDMCVTRSPVQLAWDRLTDAEQGDVTSRGSIEYHYEIRRVKCSPFQDLGIELSDWSYFVGEMVLELPPNKEGEYYLMRFWANGSSAEGITWLGAYRFRVVSGEQIASRVGDVRCRSTENPIYRLSVLINNLPYGPHAHALKIMTPYNVLAGQWKYIGVNVTKLVSFVSTDTGYVMLSEASSSPRRILYEGGVARLPEVYREGGTDKVKPSQYALFYIEDIDCIVQALVVRISGEKGWYSYEGTWRVEGSGEMIEVKKLNGNFQMRSDGKNIPVIEENWMLQHFVPQPTFALTVYKEREILLKVVGIYERAARE